MILLKKEDNELTVLFISFKCQLYKKISLYYFLHIIIIIITNIVLPLRFIIIIIMWHLCDVLTIYTQFSLTSIYTELEGPEWTHRSDTS